MWKFVRLEVKGKDLERMGGIFMTYLRIRVWFGPKIEATLIFSPCVGCVMTMVSCHGTGEYAI